MIRLLSCLLALACVVGTFTTTATATGRHDRVRLRGVIVRVDADSQTFVLHSRTSDREVRVAVGDDTHILVNGERASFRDLEVGQRAGVVGIPDPRHHVLRALLVVVRDPDDRR